jgi:hypothetical protein
MEKYLEMITK